MTATKGQGAIVLAVAVGGVIGALARYVISLGLPATTHQFPWATLIINVTGAAALGFLVILIQEQFSRARLARPLIGTGVLGAYTTFSTFMVDAVDLMRAGRPLTAALYLLGTLLGGLVAVWIGITMARLLLRAELRFGGSR